jgi:predicted RNA binding protein YcfA (HicA-like mRNA interferase family)
MRPDMNATQVIKLLESDGWVLKTQKGSHRQYVHPIKSGKITVAIHGKKDIPPGTLNSILKQAGLK